MRIAVLTESRADLGGVTPVFEEAKKRGHEVFLAESVRQIGRLPHWFIFLGDQLGVLREVVDLYEEYPRHREIGLVHLSGGDKQEGGLIDEQVRHALSKMAHVHFPCTSRSAQRLFDQGESLDRVFCIGSTMVDDLVDFVPAPVAGITGEYIIVLLHPAPNWQKDMDEILTLVPEYPVKIITPNTDLGFGRGRAVMSLKNLPRDEFLQLLWNCKVFIGNSSAMYLEAQYLGTPCVQIGERNRGREEAFPGHVQVNSEEDRREDLGPGERLRYNIEIVVEMGDARRKEGLREDWEEGAYGNGTAAKQVLDVLESIGKPTPEFLRKEWK